MNDRQKILTALMLPAFIFVGVSGLTPPGDGVPPTLSAWFAVGIVYVALSFLMSLADQRFAKAARLRSYLGSRKRHRIRHCRDGTGLKGRISPRAAATRTLVL